MAGFADLITQGIALANSLTGTLQADISYSAWLGYATTGPNAGTGYSYSSPVSIPAIIELGRKQRQDSNGQLLITVARVFLLRPLTPNGATGRTEPIDTRDVIVLPDGTTGPIVSVGGLVNPVIGRPYYHDILLGDK